MTLHKIIRFGATIWVHIIDPTKSDLWVTGRSDDFQTVVQTVAKNTASGGTNGGGWQNTTPFNANEIWKSRGALIQAPAKDNRPWVGFTLDRKITFGRGVPPVTVIDVVGYDRYLIENGAINPALQGDTPGKDARTFSGRRRDGKFVLCVAEGNNVGNTGLSFLEEYEILKEFDCDTGGNHDGGDSSTVVNTAIQNGALNVPSDGELDFVINAILWKSAAITNPPDPTDPPPTGDPTMSHYKMITAARPRSIASVDTNDTAANVPAGYEFDSSVSPQDIKLGASGPMMVKIETAGPYFNKWVPRGFYNKFEYARLITAPAPVPTEEYLDHHKADGTIQRYIPDPNQ